MNLLVVVATVLLGLGTVGSAGMALSLRRGNAHAHPEVLAYSPWIFGAGGVLLGLASVVK